jgi:hypothetical protein
LIIGLSGLIGSGKNTAADYLKRSHGYTQLAFADALKDTVGNIFRWPRHLLEGDTDESRIFRETIDQWWSQRLGIKNFTPRYALQHIGTDVFRQHFSDSIWILSVESKIADLQEHGYSVVVTDVRFPNEMSALRSLGARSLLISPVQKPAWYDVARGFSSYNLIQGMRELYPQVHESEYAWVQEQFDAEIVNSGTINDFYDRVEEQLKVWGKVTGGPG